MAASNYDVNLHLTLATTAEHEGDVVSALEYLARAGQLARDADRFTRARVFLQCARMRMRVPRLRALTIRRAG